MLKPIQTKYKGHFFRSRLEARWAVFFDELGLEWYYELEGYDLGGGLYYLPDFYLPELKCWVEIKSPTAVLSTLEERKIFVFREKVKGENQDLLVLTKIPYIGEFNIGDDLRCYTDSGIGLCVKHNKFYYFDRRRIVDHQAVVFPMWDEEKELMPCGCRYIDDVVEVTRPVLRASQTALEARFGS
jgi:hypothetical protein